MKLYISLDYKNKEEIGGSIFNLPRKKNQEAIYLYFDGVRKNDTTFELDIRRPAFAKHYTVILDEIFECKMTGKDILFYVEQRIDKIWKMLTGRKEMKVYVDLTDNELRALRTCIAYSNRCCLSCCVYPEMQQRKVECHNCEFTKNVDKIIKKFNNLQSLADYDKQVRKEVCEEIREKFKKSKLELKIIGRDGYEYTESFLDQIQEDR